MANENPPKKRIFQQLENLSAERIPICPKKPLMEIFSSPCGRLIASLQKDTFFSFDSLLPLLFFSSFISEVCFFVLLNFLFVFFSICSIYKMLILKRIQRGLDSNRLWSNLPKIFWLIPIAHLKEIVIDSLG